jgi:hypothetical protein
MSKKNPENLDLEDFETRIEKLKAQVNGLVGGEMISGSVENCPPEIEEKFWEHVLAYEQAKPVSLFDMLVRNGLALPAPDEMDDTQLTAKLWEVINAMALLGTYLESTDHLSDRELYADLWIDLLREETVLMPDNPNFACHLDVIGSGSEEDVQIYLKYYADEEWRVQWARDWPDDPMPAHEDPPFDRDRRLPRPAF